MRAPLILLAWCTLASFISCRAGDVAFYELSGSAGTFSAGHGNGGSRAGAAGASQQGASAAASSAGSFTGGASSTGAGGAALGGAGSAGPGDSAGGAPDVGEGGATAAGGSAGGATAGGASAGGGGATAGGGSAGGAGAGLVDCNPAHALCRALPPDCGDLQVPSIEGTCWGSCVKIDSCRCGDAQDCPDPNRYTCWGKQHCGPYVH